MNAIPTVLPDIAAQLPSDFRTALDWVGMEHIALPIHFDGLGRTAFVDAGVNLINPDAKGIHMSRIYLALHALSAQPLTVSSLSALLDTMLMSHIGLSTTAQLKIRFDHLVRRGALRSDQFGWQRYPVIVEAEFIGGRVCVYLSVDVTYASTCPCSAALARQLNVDAFARIFADNTQLDKQDVLAWLASPQGLAGVPHAQRSIAQVKVQLSPDIELLPVDELIDQIESALETAVQTAVKREDEQAFAALMAKNLMFCEDAARRVQATLSGWPDIANYHITVHHHESLHAHAAVARVRGVNQRKKS